MQKISFECDIKNLGDILHKIYGSFSFYYIENDFENVFFNNFKSYKLMTYSTCNMFDTNQLLSEIEWPDNYLEKKESPNIINAIFCTEDNCIILQKINILTFQNIIKKIEKNDIIVLNAGFDTNLIDKSMDSQLLEEIDSFYNKLYNQIKKNKFVQITIKSIISYMIRRYFYPTFYFKNSKFFNFDDKDEAKEEDLKLLIEKILNSKNEIEKINDLCQISEIFPKLNQKITEDSFQKFRTTDFLKLRTIFTNHDFTFSLVFHLKTFYIFMLKEINHYIEYSDEIMKNEIHFCKNYSHRSFTPFYGFLMNNDKITGFVYEYLCNGSLNNFIKSNHKYNDELFQMYAINRIFQGINYLHSHSLIYRDLKPLNILLDHDYIPYIIDFETIRHPLEENKSQENTMTSNIGSALYSSPEQIKYNNVSYPTDIYSFGLIVYFILEKKDLLLSTTSLVNDQKIQFNNASENVQNLIENCIINEPEKRIKIQSIKKILEKELNSFLILEKYLLKESNSFFVTNVIHFLCDNIFILYENEEEMIHFYIQTYYFQNLYSMKENLSNIYLNLGKYYYKGYGQKPDYLKAKEYFELAAKQQNPEAFFLLGELYYNGQSVKQNYIKAKEYYELAAKQNHSVALFNIGGLYYDGFGVVQSFQKAKEYYELSARLNNSYAYINLGHLYLDGYGVERNYFKAVECFELSSKLNNSNANVELGYCYYKGQGCEKNINKALKYFELAAEQNNTRALVFLGHYYQNDVFNRNYLKAKQYYEKAAKLNDPDAFLSLGYFYENGLSVEQNYSKAKEYYELAAKQKEPIAFAFLGDLYKNGNGVNQDYLKAKEYYELGAKQNNSTAQLALGSLYFEGLGVKKNYAEAIKYIELSAMQNNLNALLSLGNIYCEGIGVKQNHSKGIKYIELSATQNNPDAQLILGLHYYHGNGVKKDFTKAKKYFELASRQNKHDAFLALGNMYYNGDGVKQDFDKAGKYYELAAIQNNSDAFLNLGHMHFNAEGVKQDYGKAKKYYELSANLNNEKALISLGLIYLYGWGTPKDYPKAINIFESLAKQNNPSALDYLGLIYEKGFGVQKDYLKAKDYYESAAKCGNPRSYLRLGDLYFLGKVADCDYLKAKEYYEKASLFHNSNAEFQIGIIYLEGIGINQCPLKAKEYLELSAGKNNTKALFTLGCCYSEGDIFELDLTKSIDYFMKCSQIEKNTVKTYINEPYPNIRYSAVNEHKYQSMNNLGLLYIISLHDIKNGTKFIKEAAFAEYSYAQNNYGLILQFYLNDIEKAKHMYNSASEHNFSMAEFNIGHMYEKDNNAVEAIKYYIKASKDENNTLKFRNNVQVDKRQMQSQVFINCLTNLKLFLHYFAKDDFVRSKLYFIKSLNKLILLTLGTNNEFRFTMNRKSQNNIFLYIKIFILYSPCFSLFNQPNLPKDLIWDEEFKNYNSRFQIADNEMSIIKNHSQLFDLVIEDLFLRNSLIEQIKDIIITMEKILYTPPYCILFGRLSIEHLKFKEQVNPLNDINKQFYDGFDADS